MKKNPAWAGFLGFMFDDLDKSGERAHRLQGGNPRPLITCHKSLWGPENCINDSNHISVLVLLRHSENELLLALKHQKHIKRIFRKHNQQIVKSRLSSNIERKDLSASKVMSRKVMSHIRGIYPALEKYEKAPVNQAFVLRHQLNVSQNCTSHHIFKT